MLEFLEGLGSASVWAFWVPVLVWTGLAGVGAIVLARMRGLHPIAGYRLRQALLLALPVSVLAAPWVPGLLPAGPASAGPVPSVSGAVMAPSVTGGLALAADGGPGAGLPLVLLGAAIVAIALLAIGRLAVLATDLRQLHRLRRLAARVDDPAPLRRLRELAEQLGVRRPVELLEGPPDSAPMTFGAWRPVIMIPRSVLGSPDSLDAVLVHELVHIRRADYTWALLECLVSAVFAFHPLVWVLRRGIERCRETSCDAEVLSRGFARPKPYAELLAHTHVPTQFPMPAVAASLSAPSLKLKERLETMKNFAHRKLTSRQRVGIVLGAGLVCVLVAVAGACATRAEEEPGLLEHADDLEMVVGYVRALEQADAVQERAEIAAHEADVVRSYESQGLVYTLSRGSGSNQYTYRATEEDVLKELARLEVEMEYLREQRNAADDAVDELYQGDDPSDAFAKRRMLLDLQARRDLLESMRTERMREYETVKMQYETQTRLREGR
ncbi:MAG: M56 family metallopeptidase [Gemmatimonadetes bacterium]|nr:M56 family metallopeptidase [Gemmatimonadota bacterium]MYD15456.1 M56 family metallopeptidase [Gemmatimonadota bacterium]MYI67139.1 M56 family metallopeptidase [Gemmatimonadota bacterium]